MDNYIWPYDQKEYAVI